MKSLLSDSSLWNFSDNIIRFITTYYYADIHVTYTRRVEWEATYDKHFKKPRGQFYSRMHESQTEQDTSEIRTQRSYCDATELLWDWPANVQTPQGSYWEIQVKAK